MNLETLAKQIGINKNDLKQALTHSSFYEGKDNQKSNARLVFAGKYVFRGQLADILCKYYSGTGTQLQHILGNLLKNELLNRLFDKWALKTKLRANEKFDVNTHKHVFVFAILGCISQTNEDVQRRFVFKYIINNETEYIFKHHKRNNDLNAQVKFIAQHSFKKRLTTDMQLGQNNLHKATIKFANDTIICEAESKSYRYARKKAMKLALKILSQIVFNEYIFETDYLERVKQRIEQEKEQNRLVLEKKLATREQCLKERIAQGKRIKKAKDIARRKSQAEANKAKQERQKRLLLQQKEKKPISAAKRRYLEDRKK